LQAASPAASQTTPPANLSIPIPVSTSVLCNTGLSLTKVRNRTTPHPARDCRQATHRRKWIAQSIFCAQPFDRAVKRLISSRLASSLPNSSALFCAIQIASTFPLLAEHAQHPRQLHR
ncbi:hypothetical protein, partial [Cupriavidus basilensis]|uniref:hypothetical protein n=1 Tax=Cupriavidus basilensis TaxID=68895 RepID=UPI0023E7FB73